MQDKVSGKVFDWVLIKRLSAYAKPYRAWFGLALVFTLGLAALSPVRPILIQSLLDRQVVAGDIPGLRMMILLILGLLLLEVCITYANTLLTNWLGQSVIRDIRKQVFNHLMGLRLGYFDRTPVGTLQTRTVSDVETLNDIFTTGLVHILGELLSLVAIMIAMFYVSWELTLAVLLTMPLLILTAYIFNKKVKVSFQQVRKAVSEMNAFLQEHITGMQIVHIFNREKEEKRRFEEINHRHLVAHLDSTLYYSIFFPAVEIVTALTTALLVWYGSGRVMSHYIGFGELVAFIMFTGMFFRPIRMLADQVNVLQMGMVSAERIFKILDTQEIIPDEGAIAEIPSRDDGAGITFQEVSFGYTDTDKVLRNISFEVQPGEKLALVGATGSGKSTIINLLSRFYEIQEGEIRINGISIKDFRLETLRSQIGVVLQDVFLFSGTIRENITLFQPDISQERVEAAARRVGAHDFIMQLPGGYDYDVRERGATLSLGQRQLVAFARVMIYDPRILVLDEATANIDSDSEELIQNAIDTVMSGRTSIIIAHRLSTIQKADQILVLKKGEIIESGDHQALLAKQGAYYQLYEMQFAG
ncbi:MAG: ABC transporter ATP-binding protein [Bacteroidetes bacterium]|nr:MAG: ABC transporter ATP-binding protein [Bacteroidota bacterium]